MGIRSIIAVSALLSCCTIPDEVGIGANTSQYDYFASATGDPSQWPFANDVGNSYGMNIWASWRLKPQDTLVRMPRPEWIGEMRDVGGSVTHVTMKEKQENSTITEVADGASKVAESVRGDSGLQWLAGVGILCLAFYLWLRHDKSARTTSTN